MNSPNWNKIIGEIDELLLQEALSTYGQRERALPSEGKEQTMNHNTKRNIRAINRTALIAAVLAVVMAVGALAAGISIHRLRQEELRQDLNIDGANVASYVEFDTAEAANTGITLLSAVRASDWQTVYVNISPVEPEIAAQIPSVISFDWSLDGQNWGSATPRLGKGRTGLTPETMSAAVMEDAYDGESKTLTLCCMIPMSYVESNSSESLTLQLMQRNQKTDERVILGSVTFMPTELESRYIEFDDVVVTDVETGRLVDILGLELTALDAVWHIRYENSEVVYSNGAGPADEVAWAFIQSF